MVHRSPQRHPGTNAERNTETPPALEAFKHRRDTMPVSETDDPQWQAQLAALRMEAALLDERLMAECAASVERDPNVETYMREHALPFWHQINHEKETVAT